MVTTTDDTRDADDVARGYTRMPLSAGGCRQLKTTGRQTRPLDPGRPHRISAPVKLCVLAWRLERAAAIRGPQPWRTIRQTLNHLQVVRYRLQGKTLGQSTRVTSPLAEIRHRLGLPLPKKILAVCESRRTTPLASRHASQTHRVSS